MERSTSFSLRDILDSAERGQVRSTAEAGGALIFAVAEQLKQRPRQVAAINILLEPTGSVTVNSNAPAEDRESETALRGLLAQLLRLASSENPALSYVAAGPACGMSRLSEELLAAMVPFNRGAARRGLSRLHRRLRLVSEPSFSGDFPGGEMPQSEPAVAPATTAAPELRWSSACSAASEAAPPLQTPIFGSFKVEAQTYAPADEAEPTDIDVVSREVEWLHAGQDSAAFWPSSASQTEVQQAEASDSSHGRGPSEVHECARPPARTPVYHAQESVIIKDEDSVVARNPALPAKSAEPIFGAFSPRRSDVGELIGEFGVGGAGSDREMSRRLRDSVGVHGEFTPISSHAGSHTPPPVQFNRTPATPEKPKSQPWLLATVFAISMGAVWIAQPTSSAFSVGEREPCVARVRVQAEADSEVRLISGSQQSRSVGPNALFSDVACEQDSEVIVLLSQQQKNKPNEVTGWLRVPLPSERLRAAAESGKPLVISVFGR